MKRAWLTNHGAELGTLADLEEKHGSAFGDCRFCGTPTDPLSFCQSGYGVGPRLWCIRCANIECFAIGPVAKSVQEAAEKWRARPNQALNRRDVCGDVRDLRAAERRAA